MTATIDTTTPGPASAPAPRRGLRGRLSGGHLLILLAGLVAMLLNYAVLRAGNTGTGIAVAAGDLDAGARIDQTALRFVEVAATDDVLAGLVTREGAEALGDQVLVTSLAEGEVLRSADLRPAATGDGQRAMSIPIEPEHAVAGRLRPGDRVDVIEVRDGVATYLAAGVPVLDVLTPQSGGIAGGGASSITVALDDERALRVALAIRESALEIVQATGAPPPRHTRWEASWAGTGARP